MDKTLLPYLIVLLVVAIILIALTAFLIVSSRLRSSAKPGKTAAHRSLSDSFLTSLTALRSKIPGGDSLYRVPWILAAGEPDSGQTSILRQLDGESSGKDTGVEWFFLQGGALLDVPGEYLISPEGTACDDGRWKRLLRLLSRHRAHRPVDGIVLAVSATSLMASGAVADSQRASRASAVRNQLDLLQAELRMVVPVHVLVTKCDQMRGFRDFCEQLDPSASDQLFGWSSTSALETAFSPDRIGEAFDTLAARLLELQLGMFSRDLHAAVDDLFLFPAELERLRSPLKDYLARIFHETSYVEPNFLRGIYFCGDALLQPHSLHQLEASPEGTGETALAIQQVNQSVAPASAALRGNQLDNRQPRICFVRQFFELKVFPEAKIAKATRGIRLSRDRGLLATQIALAAFVLVFSIGTTMGYVRLSAFSAHRLKPTLDILSSRFPRNPEEQKNASVAAAYDLADLLGVVDVHGFRALFLPASWADPINSTVGKALADAFSKRVLIAFKNELTARVKAQKGACRAISPIPQKLPTDIDALAQLSFANDLEYQGLERSLSDMDRLRKAVNTYNDLRLAGRGSFQELDQIFRYLIDKGLDDETRFRQNPYFTRAMEEQSAGPVELQDALDHRTDFEACMAVQTESRANNFFASWFGANNPLPTLTGSLAQEVDDLTSPTSHTREKLQFLVDDVRRLDALVSSGEYQWLREPSYNPVNFPVLSKSAASEPFADAAFLQRINGNGSRAFSKLKDDLFSIRTGPTGFVLADFQGELKLNPEVNTLSSNLAVLLTQDFMAESAPSSLLSPTAGVIWHKAALQRPMQLLDAYDKYLKDNVPLIPGGLRAGIQRIAQEGLRASVLSSIVHAQEPVNPMSASDAATLMMEIRSFDEALPQLSQIAAAIGPGATASSSDLERVLFNQASALSQQLSGISKSESFFAPGGIPLSTWDGARPLSLLRFGMETPEDLEVYLTKQRELLTTFALDYAQPLEQYLQSHRLQDVNGPDVWAGLIHDVKDYDANKPGNSIGAMETFIRTGLDKINIANACQSAVAAPPSSNYFLVVRAKLQRAAVERCGEILLDRYNTRIAQVFNKKLAGNFPFGPLPESGEAVEADAGDTVAFLNAMSEVGAPLMKYLQSANSHAEIYAFLKDADSVRQFFAAGLAEDAILLDAKVSFRVNQEAEVKGNRIIEWKMQAGDGTVRLGDPANGFRWTYGSPVIVSLRFAKDSPDVPDQTVKGTDARIEGRTVRYEFRDPWSLFRLLSVHTNTIAGFGPWAVSPSGMLRFAIPTVLDPPPARLPGAVPVRDETKVFARLVFLAPAGKERREISIPEFPRIAPTLPAAPPLLSSN